MTTEKEKLEILKEKAASPIEIMKKNLQIQEEIATVMKQLAEC